MIEHKYFNKYVRIDTICGIFSNPNCMSVEKKNKKRKMGKIYFKCGD